MSNLKIRTKLSLMLVLIGLIPAIVILFVLVNNTTSDINKKVGDSLTSINSIKKESIIKYFAERQSDMGVLADLASTFKNEAFKKLNAVNAIKKSQLNDYFENNKSQLKLLANNELVISALAQTSQAFKTNRWNRALTQTDEILTPIVSTMHWYDLFLINNSGDIVYSQARESDLGNNLYKSLAASSFGDALSKAKTLKAGELAFGDYQPYPPSQGEPAAFFITPVFKGNRKLGYIAFQQPIDKVNEILGNREGLGETGESYLVGQDKLMRSNSYLNPADYSVKASFAQNNQVNTLAVNAGLNGEDGTKIIMDYNNNPVVSTWQAFDIDQETRWVIISEIDVSEAFNPRLSASEDFYAAYIEKYGYYDLFLINNDGFVFYTVTKEVDYQTNMLNGKYANSNLGQLIQRISQSKKYGLTDFAPYEPSAGAPASFIAQPILSPYGEVEMFIALQLPLEDLQGIMSIRAGMGETGESYLVGQDNRMRSNSYLDPDGRSVEASFAGNVVSNGVDSSATKAALNKTQGVEIITDYNGNPVLSSFDYIELDGFHWAILSEIDEAEAFASLKTSQLIALGLIFASVIIITVVAFLIAKATAKPILEVRDVAKSIASGDLTIQVAVTQNDEIGELQTAMRDMQSRLHQIVANISLHSESQAATSEELAAITTQTSATMEEQQNMTEQLATAMEEMGATVLDVASIATHTSQVSGESIQLVSKGLKQLDETNDHINRATEQTLKSENSVIKVKQEFQQIAEVLNEISGISDQTNLLALNAAIEAARAGEAGRGFSVVADEVRQLAQRTQSSTTQIDSIIRAISTIVDECVESMEETVSLTKEVLVHGEYSRELQTEIDQKMRHVIDSATQVATATEEQSVVIDQVVQNVHQINSGVHETNQAAHEIAKSSAQTAEIASDLKSDISMFKV